MMDYDSDSSLTVLSSELSSAPESPIAPPHLYNYPTPDSSQAQSTCSSGSEQESRKRRRGEDGEAVSKKRKKLSSENETDVDRLDLLPQSESKFEDQSRQLQTLLKALRKKKKIVVIAGAGISTSAGVPDFRSTNGLFNTLRAENKLKASGKQLFDASVYQTDASTSSFHDMVRMLSKVVNGAKPTAFHHMLATLANEGRLLRLYTQNVDALDTELDPLKTEVPLPKRGPWPKTVQLHGSLKKMTCVKCGELKDFDAELFDGPSPPSCASCIDLDKVRTEEAGKRSHGIGKLRPRMVLYNEQNPDADAIGSISASDLRARPDALIVVGTSMEIPGVQRLVKELCGVIRDRKDGKRIWINRRPPPPKYEDMWDLVVSSDCDTVAELVDMRKWYEEPREGVRISESDGERAKASDKEVKVVVKSPKKQAKSTEPLPTPLPSPKLGGVSKKSSVKLTVKLPQLQYQTVPSSKSAKAIKPRTKSKNNKPATLKIGVPTAASVNIKSRFKVTKKTSATASKNHMTEESKPFNPIPPTSARSNTAGSPLQETNVFKLEKIEVKVDSTPEAGRLKRMSEERVSPTGSLPRHMEHILN